MNNAEHNRNSSGSSDQSISTFRKRPRILFVDDEPNIISGLRRMLYKLNDVWDVLYMTNVIEALDCVGKETFDVVISDMRMPVMDGGTFLTKVAAIRPQTVRFILTGNSEFSLICKSVGSAHQCLAKPCDYDTLVNAINRSLHIGDALKNDNLKILISQIGSLPSIPTVYQEIVAELNGPDPSVKRIGEIIARDISMSAKVLQLVNSAFFGLATHVESPQHAAVLLGANVLKSLVLAVQIFHEGERGSNAGLSLEKLCEHSIDVGTMAQKIGKLLNFDEIANQDAFMAGLFHDIGKLILASKLPAYREIISNCRKQGCCIYRAEQEKLGVSHCQAGAYLLSLWGFQGTILEAVLYHHSPGESHETASNVLTAIHVANAAMNEIDPPDRDIPADPADQAYLDRKNLPDILAEGRRICQEYKRSSSKTIQISGA